MQNKQEWLGTSFPPLHVKNLFLTKQDWLSPLLRALYSYEIYLEDLISK
jgi:hypothetical protein